MGICISVKNATYSYNNKENIWENITFDIKEGDNVCILGVNGCGKTTLLNCITGLNNLKNGEITIYGKNVNNYSIDELAKILGIVYQDHTISFPYTSLEVVRMGRAPYLKFFEMPSKEDTKFAYDIMKQLGIEDLANKSYSKISGGQRQLVLIARTLVQQPKIVLFDEPTSHLDFKNQAIVMKTIKKLSQNRITTVMTSHYPTHAFKICNRVILLSNTGIIADGKPNEIMTEENLSKTYGLKVNVIKKDNELSYIDIDYNSF